MIRKKSIVISIPLVWGIRNVINSGLYNLLKNEFIVYLAVPEEVIEGLVIKGYSKENIITLYKPRQDRLTKITANILKAAHRYNNATQSDRIFSAWLQNGTTKPSFINQYIVPLGGRLFKHSKAFQYLNQFYGKHSYSKVLNELKNQIDHIQPEVALSTSYVVNWEWPLFNYLHDRKVPTATHILSFDNLTSRGYFPLAGFDQYYTWQNDMSFELTKFFGIDAKKIAITGTPQFDFHVLPQHIWDKDYTYQKLGLDVNKPYIAYCANHVIHTPGEPDLIRLLINNLKNDPDFVDYQWVIRIHPMDRYSRWSPLSHEFPQVVISLPWSRQDEYSFWAVPDNEDIALLGNTLRYAAATVTIASTVALDSCIVDTPIICVGFHPNNGSLEDHYYHDVHFSHHYMPIVSSGAVTLVENISQFIIAMKNAVDHPAIKRKEREELAKQICGPVDGKAINRIADQVIRLAYHK